MMVVGCLASSLYYLMPFLGREQIQQNIKATEKSE